jgi:hypothetical protein
VGTTLAPSQSVQTRSAVIAAVLLAIPSPAYSLEAEPAPPASRPEHAGLYLQGSAGVAYWSSYAHFHECCVSDSTIEGWGAAYGLRLGWTWTGFTLGFGIEWRTIWAEQRYENYGEVWTRDDVRGMPNVGPFMDWYVLPRRGFHLGVMPGVSECEGCEAAFNICFWAGYDIPITDRWRVGVEPRYLAGGGFFGGSSSREILLTLTYNLPPRYFGRAKSPGSGAPARGYDPRAWRR